MEQEGTGVGIEGEEGNFICSNSSMRYFKKSLTKYIALALSLNRIRYCQNILDL